MFSRLAPHFNHCPDFLAGVLGVIVAINIPDNFDMRCPADFFDRFHFALHVVLRHDVIHHIAVFAAVLATPHEVCMLAAMGQWEQLIKTKRLWYPLRTIRINPPVPTDDEICDCQKGLEAGVLPPAALP